MKNGIAMSSNTKHTNPRNTPAPVVHMLALFLLREDLRTVRLVSGDTDTTNGSLVARTTSAVATGVWNSFWQAPQVKVIPPSSGALSVAKQWGHWSWRTDRSLRFVQAIMLHSAKVAGWSQTHVSGARRPFSVTEQRWLVIKFRHAPFPKAFFCVEDSPIEETKTSQQTWPAIATPLL